MRMLNKIKHALLGNASTALFQFLAISAISHSYGISALGSYAYCLAIINIAFLFFGLGLKSIIAADQKKNFTYTDYFKFRALTVPAFLLTLLLLSLALKTNTLVFFLLLAARTADYFSEVQQGILIRHERHSLNKYLIFARGLSFYGATALSTLLASNLDDALKIASAVSIASFTLESFIFGRLIKKQEYSETQAAASNKKLLGIFNLALPLGISLTIINFNINFPRIFSGYYWDAESAGIVAGFLQIGMIGIVLVNSICQSIIPHASNLFKNRKAQEILAIKRRTFQFLALFTALTLTTSYLLADQILYLFLGDKLSSHHISFMICILSCCLNYFSAVNSALLTSFSALKSQRKMAFLMLACILTFLPPLSYAMGMEGLFLSFFLASAFRFIYSQLLIKYELSYRSP